MQDILLLLRLLHGRDDDDDDCITAAKTGTDNNKRTDGRTDNGVGPN